MNPLASVFSRRLRAAFFPCLLLAAAFFAVGCATPSAGPPRGYEVAEYTGLPPSAAADSAAASRMLAPVESAERPGLGTGWGEKRRSDVNPAHFTRATPSRPQATGKVFYNDETGAALMAKSSGFSWTRRGPVSVANGMLTVGLTDSGGDYLKSFSAGGQRFFVGEHGDRYAIRLKNETDGTVEVVVSVDGLDVLDGKSAAHSKRGYLIHPHGTLNISGFRQSDSHVAAFRFSSVRDSYSNLKHGDTRNVGVIGFAAFTQKHEYATRPYHPYPSDEWARKTADPFPDARYASPPR